MCCILVFMQPTYNTHGWVQRRVLELLTKHRETVAPLNLNYSHAHNCRATRALACEIFGHDPRTPEKWHTPTRSHSETVRRSVRDLARHGLVLVDYRTVSWDAYIYRDYDNPSDSRRIHRPRQRSEQVCRLAPVTDEEKAAVAVALEAERALWNKLVAAG